MTYETVIYEVADRVATLTLNRTERRNAIDDVMRAELGDVLMRVRNDRAVGALILTGAGGAFCSGGDQSNKKFSTAEYRNRLLEFHAWLNELIHMEKPVIAAVDGPAFGAGFSLALASDFVLATPRARFCMVFARIGFVPDLSAMFLLPRIVGMQKAKDICFTARAVGAAEAHDLGIVRALHEPDRLMAAARELAERLCHGSADAMGMAKVGLMQSFHLDYRALAELEAFSAAVCKTTDFHQRAATRLAAGKTPEFDWEALEKEATS